MTDKRNLIKLNDVRLSFPSVFRPKVWTNNIASNEGITPKYEASFILNKNIHKKEIEQIIKEIDNVIVTNKMVKSKIQPNHMCFKDGDDLEDYPEYKNSFVINCKSRKPFPIIDKDAKTPVYEHDNKIYGGCYVSAYIDIWAYTVKAKGVGANIKSIQFRKDGDPFGAETQDITNAYDPIEEDDEEIF